MSEEPKPMKVPVTVMTYPHPSRGEQVLVCTAASTESLEWVRLDPIDFRYRSFNLSDYDGRDEPQLVLVRHMMNLLRPWASCLDPELNNQGVSTTPALGPSPGPAERPS